MRDRHDIAPEWAEIGKRIRQKRLEQGLRLADVEAGAGHDCAGIELGQRGINALQAVAIAQYLGISLDYLLLGVEPESEYIYLLKENQALRRQVTRLESILDNIATYAKTGELRQGRKRYAPLPELQQTRTQAD
jgi:transcriptional regulator with XRE-family HTH domain